AALMFQGAYAAEGQDLVLSLDGETLRIPGYFQTLPPPDLVSPDGAVIRGDVAARLAGVGPDLRTALLHTGGESDTPEITAELGDPIGQVDAIEEAVSVTRADGSRVLLSQGDPIFQNDLVETAQGGTVSLTFVDGTVFSLSAGARMIIDQMIYPSCLSSVSSKT
ncbi:MAG: hypothetical protein AAGA93_10775, partial [Actinomycetota bacterium]